MPRTNADRAADRVKSLKSDIASRLRTYFRHGATFEFLLNWRTERVYQNKDWPKLPQHAKTEVNRFFDYLFTDLQAASLVNTSVFQGKRLIHGTPILSENARLVYEEGEDLQAHGNAAGCACYAFCHTGQNDRLILVPYREADREKEVASGRLTEGDIESLYDLNVIALQASKSLNNPTLTLEIQVPIIDGHVQMPPPKWWETLLTR